MRDYKTIQQLRIRLADVGRDQYISEAWESRARYKAKEGANFTIIASQVDVYMRLFGNTNHQWQKKISRYFQR
jgi:hypothetical protein